MKNLEVGDLLTPTRGYYKLSKGLSYDTRYKVIRFNYDFFDCVAGFVIIDGNCKKKTYGISSKRF